MSQAQVFRKARGGVPQVIAEEEGLEGFGVGQGQGFDQTVGAWLEEEGD